MDQLWLGFLGLLSAVFGAVCNSAGLLSCALLLWYFALRVPGADNLVFTVLKWLSVPVAAAVAVWFCLWTSMTVDYADSAVSIFALPVCVILFFGMMFFRVSSEDDFTKRALLYSSAAVWTVFVSAALTFCGFDFYVETAVGVALSVTVLYMTVAEKLSVRGG